MTSDRIATEDYADSLVMSGPTGPTGATGPEGLNWRGAWNSGTAYAVDDAVSFGGSSWISIQAGTNHSPTDDTWWDPLSVKGDTGTTGATGSTGSTGAAGADATAIYGDPVTVGKGGTGQTSLASLKTAMTFVKGDVGLGNVDNTTDAGKPVSTAQQTALDLKATAVARGRTKHGGTTDYSIPGVTLTTDNTFGLTINTLFYDFFIVDTPITLDQMAFVVTTTPATTAQVRMGIYAADTDWQPTGAPTVDAGATSVANGFTGVKTASVGVTLPAGRYMTAINCDVTLGVRVFRGFPSIGSWDSSLATGGALSGGSIGSTYGALPTPSPTAWTQGRFIGNHHCVMRISTP